MNEYQVLLKAGQSRVYTKPPLLFGLDGKCENIKLRSSWLPKQIIFKSLYCQPKVKKIFVFVAVI